ncbi:sulfite exporter TauE/SafE family protein [Jatrophihabitans telluris]|uniref:Probable membrane transporter protein n=1 Tax=Jatrophihabitans telluris TaxID=2038343 RepID=A0ABY4QUC8_9ACTN|nr:sulfite exporter TauE/SafE family protein [Jatrophihabitans telluris]UQX87296.1 sulfite exporter TauE/SafE family protein [Jatrophihabitans telluris]
MPDLSATDYVLSIAAGLVAGWVNSVAGGGSLILYPALVGAGLPTVDANVTNSVALWPGYAGNVVGLGPTLRENTDDLRRLAVPSIVGAVIGCVLLLITPSSTFDIVVPFLVIAASLLLAAQPSLTRRLGGEHVPRPGALLLSTGLGAVYGGYFGGGLGVILLATLGLTLGSGLRVANAVKGGLSLLINSVSVVVFAVFGPVHWVLVAAVAPATLVGGVVGGRFAARVDETVLRRLVVGFGLIVGLWLAYRAFR